MSRSQKRQQYGSAEYNEADFVGLRENSQGQGQGGRFYANGGRGGGGRGGGGMRKQQQQQQQNLQAQPRTFYVNAEFLQQNASEFQNAITMNGIRRRIGWGGVLDNDPCNLIGRPHANTLIATDIRLEDETSRDTITDLSVTVPSNRRNEDERGGGGGGGFVEFGNNGNIHTRDKARPRSRPTNSNERGNNSSNFRKKRRRSDSEPDARRGGGHKDKRHKRDKRRPRRPTRDEDDQDSGDMRLSSVSDELEEEDDHHEDLRNTIGRNKFRREPGEILDTDESSPSSSPKANDNKDRRGKRSTSRRKPSTKDAVVASASSSAPVTTKKNKEDSERVSSPELDIVGDSRPITAETPTKNKEENIKDLDPVTISSPELEVVGDSRPITAETPTKKKDNENVVAATSPPKLNAGDSGSRPTTAETPSKKITEITGIAADSTRVSRNPAEDKGSSRSASEAILEAKIKALRGRRTMMENEIDGLKKNLLQSERHTKNAELKLKKVEQELKLKQEEVESLKRNAAAVTTTSDSNKPDVQLIYAMAYQDRLFVEVEKVKSVFEMEVLKLQEYYESRLAHFRNQGLNPGAFLSGSNFPKGCVVTPLNIGQQIQAAHQDQNGIPRAESRSGQQQLQQQSQQMGLFAHLGNPDSVAPPIINIPQAMSRGRLPVFLNPMMRRMQGGGMAVLDTLQTMQQQPASQTASSVSNSAPSNSNNNNGNSSTHVHNGGNSGMTPSSHNSSFGRQ